MRWRVPRRFLLVAAVAGVVVLWWTRGKPSVQQMVDAITEPLLESKAAVKESERNRVEGQAAAVVSEQYDAQIGTLREGMSFRQVREILGEPIQIETVRREKGTAEVVRWTYRQAHRVLLFEDGQVTSIAIR